MLDNDVVFLLDNMVAAVEVGFSYDNIVSIPAVGLEDVARRRGVADSADKVRPLFLPTSTAMTDHGACNSGLYSEAHEIRATYIWVSFLSTKFIPQEQHFVD